MHLVNIYVLPIIGFWKKKNYGIFLNMRIFFGKINFRICKKKIQIFRYSAIIGNTHLFPLHNEPSLVPVGWKLWEE